MVKVILYLFWLGVSFACAKALNSYFQPKDLLYGLILWVLPFILLMPKRWTEEKRFTLGDFVIFSRKRTYERYFPLGRGRLIKREFSLLPEVNIAEKIVPLIVGILSFLITKVPKLPIL